MTPWPYQLKFMIAKTRSEITGFALMNCALEKRPINFDFRPSTSTKFKNF